MEQVAPAAIEAGEDQDLLFLNGGKTDNDGRYEFTVNASAIPARYFSPTGAVHGRLVSYGRRTIVHQVVKFDGFGSNDGGEEVAAARAASGLARPVTQTVNTSAVAHRATAAYVQDDRPLPPDACNERETAHWENINTSREPFVSVGRVRTKGGSEASVGVFDGSKHETAVFFLIRGNVATAGAQEAVDTSVDWSVTVPKNTNADVRAEIDYRYHQVKCVNRFGGEVRYPGIAEWYPLRPTGGTKLVNQTNEPFICAAQYETQHAGTQVINVSRGRTRATANSVDVGLGVTGPSFLDINASASTTSTKITRFTWTGKLAATSSFYLCGNTDYAIYASRVREK